MTMTMGEPLRGQPEQPEQPHAPRERRHSLTAMPTHLIELSPAFVDALKQVAPKTRRRKLPLVLGLLVVAALVVGLVPSTRQRVLSLVLHRTTASASAAPSPSDAPPIATSTTAAPTAEWVAVTVPTQEIAAPSASVSASSAPSASAPSTASAKATKKVPWWKQRKSPR
jgi:hypothetical protein